MLFGVIWFSAIYMYNEQENSLLRLILVALWILDYPSHIVRLDFSQTRVDIYNWRGAQLVKNPRAKNKIGRSRRFFSASFKNLLLRPILFGVWMVHLFVVHL